MQSATLQKIKRQFASRKEIGAFWYAMGELFEFKGVFENNVPTEGWFRHLSMMSTNQLRMAYVWCKHDSKGFVPNLSQVIMWSKKQQPPPKQPETLLEFEARRRKELEEKALEKKADPKVKEAALKKAREILRGNNHE